MKKLFLSCLIALACRISWADTKISAMTSSTTLNSGDIIPFVANPSGTPLNRVITKTNLSTTLDILTQSSATTRFNNIDVSTASLQTQITATGVSTGTLRTLADTKVNLSSISASIPVT